mgnify:CR=1 FL=1
MTGETIECITYSGSRCQVVGGSNPLFPTFLLHSACHYNATLKFWFVQINIDQEMKPFERVWMTLNHEEPDRVPIYEGSIEPAELTQGSPALYFQPGILFFPVDLLKYATLPLAKPFRKIAFKAMDNPDFILPFIKPSFMEASKVHRRFGIDLMGFSGGLPQVLNKKVFEDFSVVNGNTVLTPHGDVATKISDNYGAVSRFGFLRSPNDYNKYIEFDPDHKLNYILAKKGIEAAKGKIAIYFTVFGAAFFESLCEMFGFKTLFRLLVKEPNFIKRVVREMSDFALAQVDHLAARGVKLFYMSNDLGGNNRLIISPRMYRKYFKDAESKFCNKVHSYGGKVIMHSCGNSMELLSDLVEIGIDALHPWQPYAGMDIFEGKKRWGKDITLIGNVSIELLSQKGQKTNVVEYVKRLMNELKPGGGYIISSSHSIIPTVEWQNYVAMLWAAKKYGKY